MKYRSHDRPLAGMYGLLIAVEAIAGAVDGLSLGKSTGKLLGPIQRKSWRPRRSRHLANAGDPPLHNVRGHLPAPSLQCGLANRVMVACAAIGFAACRLLFSERDGVEQPFLAIGMWSVGATLALAFGYVLWYTFL